MHDGKNGLLIIYTLGYCAPDRSYKVWVFIFFVMILYSGGAPLFPLFLTSAFKTGQHVMMMLKQKRVQSILNFYELIMPCISIEPFFVVIKIQILSHDGSRSIKKKIYPILYYSSGSIFIIIIIFFFLLNTLFFLLTR